MVDGAALACTACGCESLFEIFEASAVGAGTDWIVAAVGAAGAWVIGVSTAVKATCCCAGSGATFGCITDREESDAACGSTAVEFEAGAGAALVLAGGG